MQSGCKPSENTERLLLIIINLVEQAQRFAEGAKEVVEGERCGAVVALELCGSSSQVNLIWWLGGSDDGRSDSAVVHCVSV